MRRIRVAVTALAVMVSAMGGMHAKADAALLMEEPYAQFGAFNPTGHAAIYLNHVCAETPTRLRPSSSERSASAPPDPLWKIGS